jgi:hypothetical protein
MARGCPDHGLIAKFATAFRLKDGEHDMNQASIPGMSASKESSSCFFKDIEILQGDGLRP